MVHIVHGHLVSLDLAYACDNLLPPVFWGETYGVFSVANCGSMVEGILRYELYSHRNLIEFFGHQFKMKIRCDRKRLVSRDFSERWVRIKSLVRVNEANLDFLFLCPVLPNRAVSCRTLLLVKLDSLCVPS